MLKKSVAMENLALSRHIFQTFVSMDNVASDTSVFWYGRVLRGPKPDSTRI